MEVTFQEETMKVSKYATGLIFMALATLWLGACGGKADPVLEGRALEFLRNAQDATKISQFLSPLMSQSTQPSQSQQMGLVPGLPKDIYAVDPEQLQKISSADISIRKKGKWAQVSARVPTTTGTIVIKTTWVKVEGQWYLFSGTDGEIQTYGKPPLFV